jgi:hypothetical protein
MKLVHMDLKMKHKKILKVLIQKMMKIKMKQVKNQWIFVNTS